MATLRRSAGVWRAEVVESDPAQTKARPKFRLNGDLLRQRRALCSTETSRDYLLLSRSSSDPLPSPARRLEGAENWPSRAVRRRSCAHLLRSRHGRSHVSARRKRPLVVDVVEWAKRHADFFLALVADRSLGRPAATATGVHEPIEPDGR